MISHCANPACDCKFLKLSKGRLFLLGGPDIKNRIQHCYWLCDRCAESFTVEESAGDAVLKTHAAQPTLSGIAA